MEISIEQLKAKQAMYPEGGYDWCQYQEMIDELEALEAELDATDSGYLE